MASRADGGREKEVEWVFAGATRVGGGERRVGHTLSVFAPSRGLPAQQYRRGQRGSSAETKVVMGLSAFRAALDCAFEDGSCPRRCSLNRGSSRAEIA